jgi:hypothetical protein
LSGARPPRFNNGWTKEQEELMAGWADIAACYRWMHDKCEKQMARSNMSTLTGSANFMLQSVVGDDKEIQKYAQIGIGGVSIFTGILTTLGNFFRYAQSSEANRVAGVAWGKFQRQVAVELALHPKERIDCMDFLKICRAELDRLIEQSPPIPDIVIKEFEKEFKDLPQLKKPDIAHGVDHTSVFKDTETRLKQLTVEAALMLQTKKKVLHTSMLPEVDKRMEQKLDKAVTDLTSNFQRTLQERLAQLEEQIKKEQEDRDAEQKQRRMSTTIKSFTHLPPAFRTTKPTVLRPFLRLPSAAIAPAPVPAPPPVPPLTPLRQVEIDHTVPSASNVTAEQLAQVLSEQQQQQQPSFPESNFSMSFHTDPDAATIDIQEEGHVAEETQEEQQEEP